MKNLLPALAFIFMVPLFAAAPVAAATPEQEKAFINAFKNAFETSDAKTLKSFLYTEGADPKLLDQFTELLLFNAGNMVTSIELVNMTPDEIKDAGATHPAPDGTKAKYPLVPSRMLVIKFQLKQGNGDGTTRFPIAEKDGKFFIPVPVPVK